MTWKALRFAFTRLDFETRRFSSMCRRELSNAMDMDRGELCDG